MIRVLTVLLVTARLPVAALEGSGSPDTNFVSVRIDASMHLRAGPTMEVQHLTRLADGTLPRRDQCLQGPEEDRCAVETLDGGLEGWAAVRFTWPHPGALESPAVEATERIAPEAPGRFETGLPPAEIFDLLLEAPPGPQIAVGAETGASRSPGFIEP